MMYLVDCYLPVLKLVSELSHQDVQPLDDDSFRQKTLETFQQAINASRQLAIPETDADDALFAMAVWFDEVILRSDLPVKQGWRNELLQMHYFNTVIGGEEFFTRLDNIDCENTALRMVYLHCLLMGFHGKYHYQDSSELIKKIETERQSLPNPWHEWPNDGEITPLCYSASKKESGILSRMVNSKYSMLWLLAIGYGLLSGLLLTLV